MNLRKKKKKCENTKETWEKKMPYYGTEKNEEVSG